MKDDPRFIQGINHFNREEFFEAHESWEDLWNNTHGPKREFVQGLIQVATAMHHMLIGNMRGARLLHDSGLSLLAPYGRAEAGIDLDRLRKDLTRALAPILKEPLERLAGRAGTGGPVKIPYDHETAFRLVFTDETDPPKT